MPPKVISGGDNPYDIHDAKLSSSATAHESSSVTAHEISNTYIDVSSRSHFSKYYLKPLLSSGKLEMMFPDKPKSKNQKYTTVHSK